MRPAGEVRQALFNACCELATVERGPTLKEIAARACVGLQAARNTLPNMVRAKQLRSPRARQVDYRNKPVAEYVPAALVDDQGEGFVDLSAVLRVWGG